MLFWRRLIIVEFLFLAIRWRYQMKPVSFQRSRIVRLRLLPLVGTTSRLWKLKCCQWMFVTPSLESSKHRLSDVVVIARASAIVFRHSLCFWQIQDYLVESYPRKGVSVSQKVLVSFSSKESHNSLPKAHCGSAIQPLPYLTSSELRAWSLPLYQLDKIPQITAFKLHTTTPPRSNTLTMRYNSASTLTVWVNWLPWR